MKRGCWLLCFTMWVVALGYAAPNTGQARAQGDALNLPAELYVLLNNGVVQRYGLGAVGVVDITPADAFVLDFQVSPDGERLAFRTEDGLYVGDLNDTVPMTAERVDENASVPLIRGRGDTLVWSSAQDAIAYSTFNGVRVYFTSGGFATLPQPGIMGLSWSPDGRYLAAEAEGHIWWIYRRDASELTLSSAIPSSIGTAWIGGGEVVFAPQDGGLYIMNLDAANTQTVVLDDTTEYRLPYLTPDGRLQFFGRIRGDETVPEGFGRLLSLERGADAVIEELGETFIDLSGGLRWVPGGTLMIAFQGGVLALFDPLTGQGFPLPIAGAVAYGWGPYPPPDDLLAAPDATPDAIFPDEFLPGTVPDLPTPEVLPFALTPESTAEVTPGVVG